jgi:hypothetical protein
VHVQTVTKRAKDLRARKLSDKDIIEQITSSNGDAHAVLREIAVGLDIGSAEIGNWVAKVRELGWARKVVPAPPLAEEDDHEIDDTDADLAVFDHEPEPASGTAQSFEVTLFRNAEGRITKRVELDDLGELNIDGAPTLWHGTARRVRYSSLADFAKALTRCRSNEAFGLGQLADGLEDEVTIVTADKLNGGGSASRISRSAEFGGPGR